jgi:hypothetical protein
VQPGVAEPDEVHAPDGTFDVELFKAAVEVFITAQEIVVDNASYPTEESPATAISTAPLASATPTSAAC